MNAIIALILRGLLLFLAYLFVGWIGYTIYKDLRTRLSGKSELTAPAITLKGVANKMSIEKQFVKTEIILGRDPDSDLIIPDETISIRHCKLTYHHKQWWANDMNSTNGSFLNDNPIETPIIITNGDSLRLGNVSFSININQ
jgi:hypothetical protein